MGVITSNNNNKHLLHRLRPRHSPRLPCQKPVLLKLSNHSHLVMLRVLSLEDEGGSALRFGFILRTLAPILMATLTACAPCILSGRQPT